MYYFAYVVCTWQKSDDVCSFSFVLAPFSYCDLSLSILYTMALRDIDGAVNQKRKRAQSGGIDFSQGGYKPLGGSPSHDEHSKNKKIRNDGGSDAVEVMEELDGKSDSEVAALRSEVATLRSEVAALQARVAWLDRPETCPTPGYGSVRSSPVTYGSDDDNAESEHMHPVFDRHLTNKEWREFDWASETCRQRDMDDDDLPSGHMHPVLDRILTNREYKDYDKICEFFKDEIAAAKRNNDTD